MSQNRSDGHGVGGETPLFVIIIIIIWDSSENYDVSINFMMHFKFILIVFNYVEIWMWRQRGKLNRTHASNDFYRIAENPLLDNSIRE